MTTENQYFTHKNFFSGCEEYINTLLYVVIGLATLSGVLLLLLLVVVYKMQSTPRKPIKKDVNPLYGIIYEGEEAKNKENPRTESIDQPYDYMG